MEERDFIIRMQDKGNNFVLLDKDLDERKVKEQMDRGSFNILDRDPSVEISLKIKKWAKKWEIDIFVIKRHGGYPAYANWKSRTNITDYSITNILYTIVW